MNMSGNTVLITGGATGIGLAFAERFLKADNEVIIVGRREEKLQEVKEKYPMIHTRTCDISREEDRKSLIEWVTAEFPKINVLINNAGIQQSVNLLNAQPDWSYYSKEMAVNFEAPTHLSMLLIPYLVKQDNAAIINISSGLALRPGVWVPIYSATKAAIHSFTISLRHQLAKTNVTVVEVFPPAVNTDLGGVGVHAGGAPLNDFADTVFHKFALGDIEIAYGDAEHRLHSSKKELDESTKIAWGNFLKNNPNFQ